MSTQILHRFPCSGGDPRCSISLTNSINSSSVLLYFRAQRRIHSCVAGYSAIDLYRVWVGEDMGEAALVMQ